MRAGIPTQRRAGATCLLARVGEDEVGGVVALSIHRQATLRSRQGGWQTHGIPVKVEVHPGAYHLAAVAGTDM